MVALDPRRTGLSLPAFKRITDADLARLQRMTEAFPPYSDHQPFGLHCWNTADDGEFAIINGNLALKLRDYDGDGYFLTFIGASDVVKTARQLLRFAAAHRDINPTLQRIPECVIRHSRGLREIFQVEAAPDDFDYIFGIPEMAALSGPSYGEKRTAIRRLQIDETPELRQIDSRDRFAHHMMLDLFDRWAESKGLIERAATANERCALERFISTSYARRDFVVTLALFSGVGTMVGFCAAEKLAHGYAIGHFEKSDPDWPGASPLMRQRITAYLQAQGCRYLNGEQDLGDPGLRMSKRSWAPKFYLRKYTIAS